ncbi:MAG: VanZ family protein [Bacteroidales bacterium]|nr:VanZ family protein [Bacteroidales bacterium]
MKGRRLIARILFFLYLAAVLVLCFGRFKDVPSVPWTLLGIPSDKLVHFCMFFPFPILAFLAFDKYTETPRSTFLFSGITFLVGVALAFGTEWGQAHLTTYRSGDPLDWLADISALFLSTLIVIIWDLRKQK